ncbi:MAG TPA: cupredoxin domain-containing protein [Chloroflexota bacterium]|jgi:plastocyanin|nr:cupredoxin domain-containing protein [Chloroflexota bacterium]
MKKVLSLGPVLFVVMLCSLVLAPWAAAAPAQQVTLSLSEFAITPSTFTVQQGQPVTFTAKNVGKFPHNVTFELTSQSMKETLFAANLTAGQTMTATYTFPAAGTWTMFCPVDSHEEKGMKGTVDVVAAAPASLPQSGGGGMAATPGWTAALALVLAVVALGWQLRLRRR